MQRQRMDGSTNWWMKHAKPATKLDLGCKLNTTKSEKKIMQRLNAVWVGENLTTTIFFWLFCGLQDEGENKTNQGKGEPDGILEALITT